MHRLQTHIQISRQLLYNDLKILQSCKQQSHKLLQTFLTKALRKTCKRFFEAISTSSINYMKALHMFCNILLQKVHETLQQICINFAEALQKLYRSEADAVQHKCKIYAIVQKYCRNVVIVLHEL